MSNEKKEAELATLLKKEEQAAEIIFRIPALKNFSERVVAVPTNKAYNIYKSLIRWKYKNKK